MINHSSLTFAQANRLTKDELESRLLLIKNPFESQLPKKEKKPEIVKPAPPPIIPMLPTLPIQPPNPPQPNIPEPEIVKEPEIPVPHVTISGIIWNSDRPQAIINGKIVDIGDTILDLKITDIQKSGVEAMFHGKSVTLKTQRSQL